MVHLQLRFPRLVHYLHQVIFQAWIRPQEGMFLEGQTNSYKYLDLLHQPNSFLWNACTHLYAKIVFSNLDHLNSSPSQVWYCLRVVQADSRLVWIDWKSVWWCMCTRVHTHVLVCTTYFHTTSLLHNIILLDTSMIESSILPLNNACT